MARDRGIFLSVTLDPRTSLFVGLVFAGIIIGLMLIVGGILFDVPPLIVGGVTVMVFWIVLLIAVSEFTDDTIEAMDDMLEPPGGGPEPEYLWDLDRGRPTPAGREFLGLPSVYYQAAPDRPEPGRCRVCGGTLFLGRPNCPHCSSPVLERID